MVHMFDMYRRDNNDGEFKFLHVFTRIESCEKWKEVRLALAKTKDDVYNPDTSMDLHRPVAQRATRRPRQGPQPPRGCKRRSSSVSPTPRIKPSPSSR